MSNGRFPSGFVDKVLAATDVAAIIGRYTTLRQRGKSLVGLCPFHQEKTPSFTVDPERGLYYCFGCHAGGSIFNFLMEKEGFSFYQAVEFLAREAGLEIPRLKEKGEDTQGLTKAAEFAAQFFQKALAADIGKEAREYLKSRGISKSTRENFKLGWAPANQLHLPNSVEKAKREIEPFIKIGLISRATNDGTFFATIRDALVFPIERSSGVVVGFAHRRIKENDSRTGPKYINSADNDIYHKSVLLYGLPQARTAIRSAGKSILVEGYFDVLALAEKGIENVVATCGTALTPNQASILARYAPKTVVLFDGDEAGYRATLRSIDILIGAGLDVFIVRLPEREDPDSFVMTEGPDKLLEKIDSATGWFDWLYNISWGKTDSAGVSGAYAVVEVMAIPLAAITDGMAKNMYIRDLAGRLGTSEESLREQLKKEYRKQRYKTNTGETTKENDELPADARLELALIASILGGNGEKPCEENPLIRYPGLWDIAISGVKPAEILAEIADERTRSFLSEILLEPEPSDVEAHRQALLLKLRRVNIDRKIRELNAKLDIAERSGSDIEKKQIFEELSKLARELGNLSNKEP
ncbi:DNA primase [bacterium]|nr:MAG: DNA primase [bacterium]